MSGHRYDVIGIGNAIVDVLARVEEDFLLRESLHKGSMALIDEPRAEHLYGLIGQTVLVSGGSAANTCAGVASLGARAAFIGKVRDDQLGSTFAHDMNATGVTYRTPQASDGPTTGRCMILVTPDGERTMNTFLGASLHLEPEDVDAELIEASAITYLEGYLWDPPPAKAAFRRAAEIAHGAGRKVALSLSDLLCVERHRPEFLELLRGGTVDLVFANEAEAKAMFETSDLDTAIAGFRDIAQLAVVTRSEHGSLVVTGEETFAAEASPIERMTDATGAGDVYASGFLTGLVRGLDYVDCARLGSLAAAHVIQHMGARPQRRLADLAAENGFQLALPA